MLLLAFLPERSNSNVLGASLGEMERHLSFSHECFPVEFRSVQEVDGFAAGYLVFGRM